MSKGFLIALLGGAALMMVGAGCTNNTAQPETPYGLTGTNPNYQTTTAERLAWTDEKGHYRSDWQAGINRPPQYPKAVAVE